MRQTELDLALHRLARSQHLLFSRRQATELGASERFIGRRLARGDWLKPDTGVYGLVGASMTWRRQLKAAELSAHEAAIGGTAAAALHSLTDFRPGRPEIVVPPGVSARSRIATVHRQVGFPTTVVDGIRVTTVAQTLFDVAPISSVWRLERAMDDALRDGRLSVPELDALLEFYAESRRNGLPRIRPLIIERRAEGWIPPASDLEARLFAMLDRVPSRPAVIRQHPFAWRQPAAMRVDGFLPGPGIICEGDGRRWHTRVADFDRDRWRDNQAAAHGVRVLRFTWAHLTTFVDESVALVERAVHARWAA